MATIDNYIDNKISKKVVEENKQRELQHVSSGRLSASMLGEPLQWQILKIKGVKPKEIDEYTLRKFIRGKDVELWLLKYLDTQVVADGKQDFVEYRGVVGFIDAVCDTKDWDFPKGVMPVEVKSTSNAKFKRVVKSGEADKGHCLQGCLYALARGTDHFAVMYVATDDLRVHTFTLRTEDYKGQVDAVIDRFEKHKGQIPVFEPEEKWQADIKYNKYPEWSNLTIEEITKKYEDITKDTNNTN